MFSDYDPEMNTDYEYKYALIMTLIWLLFQAHKCPDKALAQKMFLPLAERMTKKFVEDGKIEAEAGKIKLNCLQLQIMHYTFDSKSSFGS